MFIQKSFEPIVRLLWWKKQTETVKSSSKTDYIACQCEIWPRKLSSANNQQTWLCFNKAYNKNKSFSFLAMMRFISYPTYVMSKTAPLAPKFSYFLAFLKISKYRKQNNKLSHPPKNQRDLVHCFALASKSGWIKN